MILQKMHTVESDYKSQVSKLESDLEDQRAKNNVSSHFFSMISLFETFEKKPTNQMAQWAK